MNMIRLPNVLRRAFGVVTLGLLVGMISVYADWTAPTNSFPTCPLSNPACNTPLNIGSQIQSKTGKLTLQGGLDVANTIITGLGGPPINGTDAANKAYVDAQVSTPQIRVVKASGQFTSLTLSCPAGYIIFKCGAGFGGGSIAGAESIASLNFEGNGSSGDCPFSTYGTNTYTSTVSGSPSNRAVILGCAKQ